MTRVARHVGVVWVALLASFQVTNWAAEFRVFGPQVVVRGNGKPVKQVYAFTVLDPAAQYTLRIDNGGSLEPVTSADVWLNGVLVIGPSRFKKHVAGIAQPVTLAAENRLAVQLQGKPGSGFTIQVIGGDNDDPIITAVADPPANEAGWHNVDVTVRFECTDATSGIADCTAPVVVATEGANQVVTGTARDRAGNTASVSVTLNVDKTAPVLSDFLPPGGATLPDPEVNLTGTIRELLSGIAETTCDANNVSEEATVNHEVTQGDPVLACSLPLVPGDNLVMVHGRDVAGNLTTSFLNFLHVARPTVTIESPDDLELFFSSPIPVTGTVDDAAAVVTVNEIPAAVVNGHFTASVPLGNGFHTITATAVNAAGSGSASVRVFSIVGLSPTVRIESPSQGFVLGQNVGKGPYPLTVTGWVRDNRLIPLGDTEVIVRFNGSPAPATVSQQASGLCVSPQRCWTYSATQLFPTPDGVSVSIEVEATTGSTTTTQQRNGIVDFCVAFNAGQNTEGCQASLFQDGCRQSRRCIENADGCSNPAFGEDSPRRNDPTDGSAGLSDTAFGQDEDANTPEGADTVFGQRRPIQLPCNRHDECYHQWCPAEQSRSGEVSTKNVCNDRFLTDMQAVCRRAYPEAVCPADRIGLLKCPQWRFEKTACYSWARIYYSAVSAHAQTYYLPGAYYSWPYWHEDEGGVPYFTPCEGCPPTE